MLTPSASNPPGRAANTANTANTATAVSGNTGLAGDARSLEALRNGAGKNPRAAVQDAARQFESLFMNELMKSMRAANSAITDSAGLMDNAGTKLGTELLDAQLATKMTGQPGGLSDVIARQLERQMGLSPGPIPPTGGANNSLPTVSDPRSTPKVPEKSAAGFVQQHSAAANAASASTGIPAQFMLAQAALETGWGKREIIGVDV